MGHHQPVPGSPVPVDPLRHQPFVAETLIRHGAAFDAGETFGEGAERVRKLKNLFKETQSLPQVQVLSEDDILREVEEYRNGK